MIRQGARACVRLCLLFVVRCLSSPCLFYDIFIPLLFAVFYVSPGTIVSRVGLCTVVACFLYFDNRC
jgi:hypothetical protein